MAASDVGHPAALSGFGGVKLADKPTPNGMKAFGMKFAAHLPQLQAQALRNAYTTDSFEPVGTEQKLMYEIIYDKLLTCVPSALDDDMLNMTNECGRNGPKCLKWLDARYDPDGMASHVKNVFKLFSQKVDSLDPVGGINRVRRFRSFFFYYFYLFFCLFFYLLLIICILLVVCFTTASGGGFSVGGDADT